MSGERRNPPVGRYFGNVDPPPMRVGRVTTSVEVPLRDVTSRLRKITESAAATAVPAIDADLLAAIRSALAEGVGVEDLLAGVERMRRDRARESSSCTGVAASWCPVCGDCTCPVADDGVTRPNLDGEDCRLHGKDSDHCERADDAEVDHDPTASATDYGAELQRQRCKACWSACGFDYHVTDEAWAAVVPEALRDRVVCLMCFDRFARAAGIDYRGALSPELYFAGDQVSLVLLDKDCLPESRPWTCCAESLPKEAGRYEAAAVAPGGGRFTVRAHFNGEEGHWAWSWSTDGLGVVYAWRPLAFDPPPLRPADSVYLLSNGTPPEWLGAEED